MLLKMLIPVTMLSFTFWHNSYSQTKDRISIGLNFTYLSDWKNKPIIFFNPEIRYTKPLNTNSSIEVGLGSLYGKASAADFQEPGDVFQRLLFSTDVVFKKNNNHFSAVIGPAIRYRNEKIRANCSNCPPWEFRTNPQKSFFDFGGVTGINYEFLFGRRYSFEFRMAYRIYNKGINPISLGFYYSRFLK